MKVRLTRHGGAIETPWSRDESVMEAQKRRYGGAIKAPWSVPGGTMTAS